MAVFECLSNLNPNVDNFAQRERAFALEPAQVCSLDNGHDKEQRSFVLAKVEDRYHRRMIHLGHQLRFALEALFSVGAQQCWRNKLDGNFPVQHGIVRPIDDAHSAATQLRPDVVSVRKPLTDHLPSMKNMSKICESTS